jgi:sulfite reductase (NADPH) flavoprotein alpha-component
MTISIWRYSHLALAVSSFLFLLLASVTGIILAFDPITQKTKPYRVNNFKNITLAEAIPALRKAYPEITDITVDANQFVVLHGTDQEGNSVSAYVDPRTGKSLGVREEQSTFFQWVTAMHRSLFLKETGRFIIGLTSFLLVLIAISGTILVIRRQRGVKRFFTRIVRENFGQYYHVVLGRLSLIPIIIVALTGTYLSLARFEIVKTQQISHKIDFDTVSSGNKKEAGEFSIFKNTLFGDIQSVEFPFSDDPEDYYTLKLSDRELIVDQFSGAVLSEVKYSASSMLTSLSLDLHTGRTNIIWAIILAIATLNILFFIYSGFAITLKRRSNRVKNKYKAEESRFIILVGSENGNTFHFAKVIFKQLLSAGEKCFIAELNNYDTYPSAQHLVILTATYGLGDAPVNAAKFMERLKQRSQFKKTRFSVVGFGSRSYPDFCQFAFEVNNELSKQAWAQPLMEIHTVNDRSPDEFMHWASTWSALAGLPLMISREQFLISQKRNQNFIVVERSDLTHTEGAFLIKVKPRGRVKYRSGDLLAIYPSNDHLERLYSIGKIGDALQLSVKLHPNGLGSGYLHGLKPGETIKGRIDKNPHFHFPAEAANVIMICNGTGIAPFLGMIHENKKKIPCFLYCGFRGEKSFDVYQNILDEALESRRLSKLEVAYSREGVKKYVKDILADDEKFVAKSLAGNGVIMICGSLAMQQNVIELLEAICQRSSGHGVSYYQANGQILMDCY